MESTSFFDKIFYSNELYLLFNSRFYGFVLIYRLFSSIRKWRSISFFSSSKIFTLSNLININRLKNLFIKNLNCFRCWNEISKLIDIGLVGFADEFILEGRFYLKCSFFSVFLLELYFYELDVYLFNLYFKSSIVKNLRFFSNFTNRSIIQKNFCFFDSLYSPNKFEKHILKFKSLKNLNFYRMFNFKDFYSTIVVQPFFLLFIKEFKYIRYKNHLLFGIIGSFNLNLLLKSKVLFFVRSNLNMELHFSGFTNSIRFLGFDILNLNRLDKLNGNLNYNLFEKNKLTKFLVQRVDNFRNKLVSLFIRRLNLELLSHVNMFFDLSKLYISSSTEKYFWTFIFQFEAVRSSQVCRLITKKDINFFISEGQLSTIKSLQYIGYKKYIFSIYLYKCRLMLSDLSGTVFSYIDLSIFPNDINFSSVFLELKKKLFFNYVSFNRMHLDNFTGKINDFNDISSEKAVYVKEKFLWISLNIPFVYLFSRLRSLGFLHFEKYRPIGNSKFFQLSDKVLIKAFGFLAYNFIFWYRFAYNFSKIKIIISFLRQSCLLTLCRKHNKSKFWAYKVYTTNLIVSRGLFNSRSFFPSLKFTSIRSSFFLKEGLFLFNERFFLHI